MSTLPPTSRGHETKAKLLRAAAELFLERGWEEVTAQQIRLRAGVSHGSLMHFFPGGKAALGAATFTELYSSFWASALEPFVARDRKGVRTVISTGVRRLLADVDRSPSEFRLLLQLETALLQTREAEAVWQTRSRKHAVLRAWSEGSGGAGSGLTGAELHAVIFGAATEWCGACVGGCPETRGSAQMERFIQGALAALDEPKSSVRGPLAHRQQLVLGDLIQ